MITGKLVVVDDFAASELWGYAEEYWLDMLGRVLKTGKPEHMTGYCGAARGAT